MARKKSPAALPEMGSVYGFQTEPLYSWNPSPTGRFGAAKVLGLDPNDTPVFAVLDGVFPQMPSLAEAAACAILKEDRFSFGGRQAAFGAAGYTEGDLARFTLLGRVEVTADEAALAENIRTYMAIDGCDRSLEAEWRFANDRDLLEADIKRENVEQAARDDAEEAYYETCLKDLTFDTLLSETQFDNWAAFEHPAFDVEAREAIRTLMQSLQSLGPKPKKAEARKLLKACVAWFNEADTRHGGVIVTEERDDICGVLFEIAHVARHPSLAEEIDNWRDW